MQAQIHGLSRNHRRRFLLAALAWGVAVAAAPHSAPAQAPAAAPTIEITVIPPAGGGSNRLERIGGRTTGANPVHRVVLYALTNVWYVQPYIAEPYTSIENNTFSASIHLGREYAALLVTEAFTPPATLRQLPPLGSSILAIARVNARDR